MVFWHDWRLQLWSGTFLDWDLEAEVAKIPNDVWDKGVEAAVRAMGRGLAACGKWLAGKGDLTVDTLIKLGVPAGSTAWVLANPGKVQALIDAVMKWMPFP